MNWEPATYFYEGSAVTKVVHTCLLEQPGKQVLCSKQISAGEETMYRNFDFVIRSNSKVT